MRIIEFIGVIILASIVLNSFYGIQRKLFNKSYYSFFELITGLPTYMSFNQLFFIKFIPPFLISLLTYSLTFKLLGINYVWYSLIGLLAALENTIPSMIDIKIYQGTNASKKILKEKISSIYLIYFLYILSFVLLTGLGAYLGSNFNIYKMLPSQQGLIDGIWIAFIIAILSRLNKPL